MSTTAQQKKKIRSELLKLNEKSILDLDFVSAEAGDLILTEYAAHQHQKIKNERGSKLYADMLFVLTNQEYEPEKAKLLWSKILRHKEVLSECLKRNPGIVVSALDYFTNVEKLKENIALIHEKKLAHVMEVAITDGMTGLYDHASFQHKLAEELARYRRHGTTVALIMADVDFFKEFNDQYGHKKGDFVLKKMSAIILKEIREVDIGARYGGEEFSIIACSANKGDAYLLAERIRKRVMETFACRGRVTMSFGVADCTQTEATRSCLVEAADLALYRAKAQGRNCTVIYRPEQKLADLEC